MSNKRVSELAPITSPELDFGDLLLLSDISAHESKKLQLSDLSNFLLLDGHLSGSLFGTASYANFAGTASIALNAIIPSLVPSASFLVYTPGVSNGTASYALAALSSSYSLSSSYAITASYALTSSVELVYSSAFADYARTASYLLLTPGSTNGTASYALTASFLLGAIPQVSASYAQTASYSWFSGTASYVALAVQSLTASIVNTASYLMFNGQPNGTASYALTAGNIVNNRVDYGVFLALTQSITSSQLDTVIVSPTFGGLKKTEVEANGTIRLPFTSSARTDGAVTLWVLDRNYGFSQSLDSTPVTALLGGAAGLSGSIRIPFSLHGQTSLNGTYQIYVTASNGAFIDGTRTCRFDISSETDQLYVNRGDPLSFTTTPNNTILLWSSSLHPGTLYRGSASQVTFSGSADVTELWVPQFSASAMNYTWTLTGLQRLIVDNNSGLTSIGGLPSGIISMSANNCSLVELPPLISSSISYLNVPNNNIVTTMVCPPSMSFINVANNFYVNLPTTLPAGLMVLVADSLGFSSTPSSIPNSLVTMSLANCPNFQTWLPGSFPSSLTYINMTNSPVANIPSAVPSPLLFVNVSNCQLGSTAISGLAQGLVTNALSNGSFNFLNNPNSASALNIIANITTLRGRGWTITS